MTKKFNKIFVNFLNLKSRYKKYKFMFFSKLQIYKYIKSNYII